MSEGRNRWLGLILLVALGLRLLPWLAQGHCPALFMVDSDSWQYHQIALNLLAGHGYSSEQQPPYEADVYRPPGYPGFLRLVYGWNGPAIPTAILLQILLSLGAILLTYHLVRAAGGSPRLANLAALLLAIDPLSIVHANLLLTEIFSSLILLAALLLVARYWQSGSSAYLLLTGALFGAGILVHPMLVFLPLLLIAVPWLTGRTRTYAHAAYGLLAAVLGLAPALGWMARNQAVADYGGISCVAAVNLLKYKAAGVMADLHGTSREVERDRLTRECEAELPPGATQGTKFRLWQRKGLAILRDHPLVFGKVFLKGILVELLGPDRDNLARFLYGEAVLGPDGKVLDTRIHQTVRDKPVLAWELIRYLALAIQAATYLFLLVGLTAPAIRKQFHLLLLLLLPALYVMALTGGPEGEPRFRVIYMPFFCMAAAVGAVVALDWIASLRQRSRTAFPGRPDGLGRPSYSGLSGGSPVESLSSVHQQGGCSC
jgi:4-amino-4-deoxy-L-arabinose transferase-like glycosyltransferase